MNIISKTFKQYQDLTKKIGTNFEQNFEMDLHFSKDILLTPPELIDKVIKHRDGTIQLNKILYKSSLVEMNIKNNGFRGRIIFYSIDELETFLKNNKII